MATRGRRHTVPARAFMLPSAGPARPSSVPCRDARCSTCAWGSRGWVWGPGCGGGSRAGHTGAGARVWAPPLGVLATLPTTLRRRPHIPPAPHKLATAQGGAGDAPWAPSRAPRPPDSPRPAPRPTPGCGSGARQPLLWKRRDRARCRCCHGRRRAAGGGGSNAGSSGGAAAAAAAAAAAQQCPCGSGCAARRGAPRTVSWRACFTEVRRACVRPPAAAAARRHGGASQLRQNSSGGRARPTNSWAGAACHAAAVGHAAAAGAGGRAEASRGSWLPCAGARAAVARAGLPPALCPATCSAAVPCPDWCCSACFGGGSSAMPLSRARRQGRSVPRPASRFRRRRSRCPWPPPNHQHRSVDTTVTIQAAQIVRWVCGAWGALTGRCECSAVASG